MAEPGGKRPAEHQLHPEDDAGPGAARNGAGDDVEAPFSDVKPAIQPSDVHVLLADDEKISRLVTSKLLRMCGYHVTCVESGRQLLLKLAESPGSFHLILTDVAMPDVNGLEVLRYVRSQPALQALPVIMMSAHENAGTVFECVKQGAEDYLLKPVTQKEIKQIWQHVWRRRSTLTRRSGPAPGAQPRLEVPPESYEKPNTPSAGSKGDDDTELYTAAEMKAHCQRQLARYTRILHVIDTHPHLFPAAAEPKPEDAAAAAAAAQELS